MNIASVAVGPDQPCRVVSEISNAHNGDLSTCLRIIRECAKAGVDFVKLQCFVPDELIALRGDGSPPPPWDHMTMRELYSRAQTPHEWFPAIVAECKSLGVPWFSSVFGPESLALLESLDCPAYKIASLDRAKVWDEAWLRFRAYDTGRPILVSTPHEPIENRTGLFLLHCPEGYPQTEGYDPAVAPGFSYHGTDWQQVWRAAIKGAQLVEVHVQLDDEPSELEAGVSLTVSQLRTLCKAVKITGRKL